MHANANLALAAILDNVLIGGATSSPRGKLVKELIGTRTTFDMRFPLVTRAARKLGYKFAPAEAAWIISGSNDLERIKKFSPFIWEFSDDGFFYSGAYGPRVIDQLTYVCDVLSDDHDTRQAVIEVWRPNPRPGRDIPCTLSYQFIAREGRLHCIQSMRSSDAWLGYPYDVFNAAMLTGYIMLLLRDRKARGRVQLEIGSHTMFVGSQHIYEPQWTLAKEYLDSKVNLFEHRPFNPYEFQSPQALVDHLWKLAGREWDRLAPGTFLVDELSGLTAKE